MIKIFRKALMTGLMLATAGAGFAQEAKTADELKAERVELKTELKSKDVLKREEKIAKLAESAPKATNAQSVDGLAQTSVGVLGTVVSNNNFLSNFKREITDNENGEIDVTVHKAKLEDYTKLAGNLLATSKLITDGTAQLKDAQDDVKKLSKLEALSATKSLKFSTEGLKLSGEEVALQLKLVNNLIATIKSSENL
jgi:hypothetical protein